MWIDTFPLIRQYDRADCGLACLSMICKYYHLENSFDANKYQFFVSRDGISLEAIIDIAKQENFEVKCGRIELQKLITEAQLPCILYWDKKHFVVLYKIIRKSNMYIFKIADPSYRKFKCSWEQLLQHWGDSCRQDGIVVLLQPSKIEDRVEHMHKTKKDMTLFSIVSKYKRGISYIGIGVFIGAVIQVILPFLTQNIVDRGIRENSMEIIFDILLAQMALVTGNMLNDFFRRNLVLKIGSLFTMNILTNMVKKLLQLPVRFFDSRQTGDFLQRLQDNDKVERFVTTHFVNMVFSVVTIIVLSVVMCIYSLKILIVFLLGSLIYVGWASFFVIQRKNLNYSLFSMKARNQSKFLEIINGIYEIKLQNNVEANENEIRDIQKGLYNLNMKAFRIDQGIQVGYIFINELKNLIITFLSAYLVIKNKFTLGTMLSIQYIIGEMNVPINQFITYINGCQDAKFSLDRLNSIFTQKNEELGKISYEQASADLIRINNLSFRYLKTGSCILDHISLCLPRKAVIAIVGSSGSGKTTLIKLLLKLYYPDDGEITIGDVNLNDIDTISWRKNCGAVMQDGFLFSDTIRNNIIMNSTFDQEKFNRAVNIANVDDFVKGFAYRYETVIGSSGMNMSQGQKQRVLIARTIYKDPQIFFFDEATNALDAKNERSIVMNMKEILVGKTTFIVAHRLSTVKNADLILVMDHGRIVEQGNHKSLIDRKGFYYQLIKNQLEIAE